MKLLIISHNCISNNNNMGRAMQSIVSSFKKEELCQLYLYPSIPDIDVCNSYYRITDKEVLKSIFSFKKYGHEIDKNYIKKENMIYEKNTDRFLYNFNNHIVLKKYIREVVWKFSNFLNDNLIMWLKKEKPTQILIFPGKYCFFYDLAIKIGNYLNIPVTTYFMDNFYDLNCINYFDKLYQNKLDNKVKKIVKYSKYNITLSSDMSRYYSKIFNKQIKTIMLGSSVKNCKVKKVSNIRNITYIGNLSNKRYINLIEIGNELDKINFENNSSIILHIYGNMQDENILKKFNEISSIKFEGFVKDKKYIDAIMNADVLVHVESFDNDCIELVKYSVSTKISEILTSGRCVLAYGPENISSLKYLKKYNAAFIVSKKKDLYNIICKLLNDLQLRNMVINNGIKAAINNQDCMKNSKKLYLMLSR